MDRRVFIAIVANGFLATPLAAEAQPAGKPWRVGMRETTSAAMNAHILSAFRQGLK